MDIIIATGNPHKLNEFSRMFSPLGYKVTCPKELNLDFDPVEDGTTFAQNARKKATALVDAILESKLMEERTIQFPFACVADDSGLAVDALGGQPGVYSARYSGKGDAENNKKLLAEMEGVPTEERTARFIAALCCVIMDGKQEPKFLETEGRVEGIVDTQCRGTQGFGYDCLFLSDEVGSFGLASPEEKDKVSHRGRALKTLVSLLKETEI